MDIIQEVELLLQKRLEEEEYQAYFLVDIKFNAANKKLDVYLDGDEGINLRICTRFNKYLQEHIDEAGWLGEKYTLDVSSPGIGKPLKFYRQYPRNVGRKIEVKLADGTKEEGTLLEVSEAQLVLEQKVRVQEGKRKKTTLVQTPLAFENITETVVKISFK